MKKEKIENGIEKVEYGIVEEVSEEEWNKMKDVKEGVRGSVNWEEVWNRVRGRILSWKGFEKVVNEVRGEERKLYWSEKDRVFENWKRKGRKIEEKIGFNGSRNRKFYRFSE